jgi:hypothetical protein
MGQKRYKLLRLPAAKSTTEHKGKFGRVEDGRGNLGHAASPRFPPPLIELYVPISGIQLSDWFHRKAHDAVDKGKRSRRSRRCSP